MLERLSKKHGRWIKYALSICKHKQIAEDLVQDMYLKIHRRGVDESKLTNSYIYTMLLNEFKTIVTKRGKTEFTNIDSCFNIKEDLDVFELDDEALLIIDKVNNLPDKDKRILLDSYDKPLRVIAENEDTYFVDIHRELKRIKNKIINNE